MNMLSHARLCQNYLKRRRGKAIGLFLFALIFFSTIVTSYGNQKMVTVNYPPDMTVMEFEILGISLTVPSRGFIDLIEVDVNNRDKKEITPDSEFECFSVLLKVGKNVVTIRGIKEGRIIDESVINVFRRSDLERGAIKPPTAFQRDYFHMKDNKKCRECHKLEPTESDRKPLRIAAFPTRKLKASEEEIAAESTCYSCHKALTSAPFVHGPAAVWSCLSCHDPRAEPKYAVRKPDTKACFGCHIERKEKWYAKKFFHGPFNTGKCAICHNPHSAEYPFNLVKSTWELCTSCHIDKGSGQHIVKRISGMNYHPTRGKQDPSREGKELTCASCHEPHATDSFKLLRFDIGHLFDLCRKCHNK